MLLALFKNICEYHAGYSLVVSSDGISHSTLASLSKIVSYETDNLFPAKANDGSL